MPVPVGYYDATFIFQPVIGTRQSTFSLGLQFGSTPDPTPTAVANDMFTIATATNMPFNAAKMIDDWTLQGVSVAQGDAGGDIIGQKLQVVTGTLVDSTIPLNGALLVKKNTTSGGRRNRGRMFVPPVHLNEGAVDSIGIIGSAQLAPIQTMFAAWFTAIVAGDYIPQLFHQGVGAPGPTGISSFTCTPLIGTQRRRMRN